MQESHNTDLYLLHLQPTQLTMEENISLAPNFNLVKLIPATAILTCFSQLSTVVFYDYFYFDPITYFDVSEIIFSSIKSFILIGIGLTLYLQIMITVIIPVLHMKDEQMKMSDFGDTVFGKKLNYLIGAFTLFICILIYFAIGSVEMLYLILQLIVISLLMMFNNKRFSKLEENEPNYFNIIKKYYPRIDSVILLFVVGVTIIFYISAWQKAKSIYRNNPSFGSELILKESKESIKCTSRVLFIGKSNKYYFIFSRKDLSMRVINREQIAKEVIRTNFTNYKVSNFTNFLFNLTH